METQASKFCIFPEDTLFSWCVESGLEFLCEVSEERGSTKGLDQGHLKSFALYRGHLRSPGRQPSSGHPLLSVCLPALSPVSSPLLIALSQTLTWIETLQLNQMPCRPPKLWVGHLSWHHPTFLIPHPIPRLPTPSISNKLSSNPNSGGDPWWTTSHLSHQKSNLQLYGDPLFNHRPHLPKVERETKEQSTHERQNQRQRHIQKSAL